MAPPPQETSRSESAPVPIPTPPVVPAPESAPAPTAVVLTVDVLTAARELKLKEEEKQVWQYLDVRTEEEMAKGHVHNSLNIPYMFVTPQGTREKNPLFVEQVSSLFTKDQHILIGCQSGKRSELACIDFLAAGFMNVKNIGGGYIAWVEHGLPIVVPAHTPPAPTPTESAKATPIESAA